MAVELGAGIGAAGLGEAAHTQFDKWAAQGGGDTIGATLKIIQGARHVPKIIPTERRSRAEHRDRPVPLWADQ